MKLLNSELVALAKVHTHFITHPTQRVPIKDLTLSTGMSENKLTKGFKQIYGMSIHKCQLTLAMNHAKTMLESGHRVKEVANVHGYSTSASFARAFAHVHKVPPHAFKVQ